MVLVNNTERTKKGDLQAVLSLQKADFITDCLTQLSFEILDLQRKQYPEPDGSFLTDIIFIARKKKS